MVEFFPESVNPSMDKHDIGVKDSLSFPVFLVVEFDLLVVFFATAVLDDVGTKRGVGMELISITEEIVGFEFIELTSVKNVLSVFVLPVRITSLLDETAESVVVGKEEKKK